MAPLPPLPRNVEGDRRVWARDYFFEPDAFQRQAHRDMDDPPWARVWVYPASPEGWQQSVDVAAKSADVLIKASGVGIFDTELDEAVATVPSRALRIYWDVDAPATLDAMASQPQHHLLKFIPRFDLVLTYGGGDPVIAAYPAAGARDCVPIYNALDPATHFPVPANKEFDCHLSLLGNRLPDREERVDHFFLDVASRMPSSTFVLGGSGWETKRTSSNVRKVGHYWHWSAQRILRIRTRDPQHQSKQHWHVMASHRRPAFLKQPARALA